MYKVTLFAISILALSTGAFAQHFSKNIDVAPRYLDFSFESKDLFQDCLEVFNGKMVDGVKTDYGLIDEGKHAVFECRIADEALSDLALIKIIDFRLNLKGWQGCLVDEGESFPYSGILSDNKTGEVLALVFAMKLRAHYDGRKQVEFCLQEHINVNESGWVRGLFYTKTR